MKLGSWVARQRTARSRGQLAEERVQRLEALAGWVWSVNNAAWDEGYAHLLHFVQCEGNSRVPWNHRADDGYRLGAWVHLQRQARKRGELSKERARRLQALPGWVWTPRANNWDDAYDRLVRYVEREGHARVPAQWREDGYRLGQWVVRQRVVFREQQLDGARRARLEALPGWTWGTRSKRPQEAGR